jgi:hypothetical protein
MVRARPNPAAAAAAAAAAADGSNCLRYSKRRFESLETTGKMMRVSASLANGIVQTYGAFDDTRIQNRVILARCSNNSV